MMQIRSNKLILTPVLLLFIFYLSIHPLTTLLQLNISKQDSTNTQVRIYCLILTSPQYFDTRARAVNSTWAPRCDKFSFISEYSNDTKDLPIAPIANISSGYGHLTQKTTLALHYVYENHLNDFDWFVKADDDTYLFVENLKSFLKDQNSSEPITFGYNFKVCLYRLIPIPQERIFLS
jgi:glycoprotein-N-acetylgalactosamine 3-beta-galactosyltransferase